MNDIQNVIERRMVADNLRGSLEASLEDRVDRYLEINKPGVVADHHFAVASAECIRLYTDGYFLSAVMVAQAVAEGMRNFIIKRNEIKLDDKVKWPEAADLLVEKGIITKDCADAFGRIYNSFRNDLHHMWSTVATIPFPELAKSNIHDLTAIEREVFASEFGKDGRLILANPKYWDAREDGKVRAFLRLEP